MEIRRGVIKKITFWCEIIKLASSNNDANFILCDFVCDDNDIFYYTFTVNKGIMAVSLLLYMGHLKFLR